MSSVRYDHVTCQYPGAERPSVTGLDLSIAAGEFLGADRTGQLDRAALPALRRRALSAAVVAAGGQTPAYERLGALDEFAAGHGAAGPVQMAGKVSVWRRRPTAGTRGPGHLELVRPRPASATRPASASPEERREG